VSAEDVIREAAELVREKAERLVLFGWLKTAGELLQRAGQYMADREQHFSEDVFDELRTLSERVDRIAHAVREGDEHRI
jgi:hypothetical protein